LVLRAVLCRCRPVGIDSNAASAQPSNVVPDQTLRLGVRERRPLPLPVGFAGAQNLVDQNQQGVCHRHQGGWFLAP
jgi:hypothetical protein